MPQVTIDGQAFDIPDDELTGRELKARAQLEPGHVLYAVPAPGAAPRVVDDDERVRLAEGSRLGVVRPFLTGAGA